MEEQSQMEQENQEKKKGGRAFIVFLLIISLLGNGYLVFDYVQGKKNDQELMQMAKDAGISLDSLQAEYDAIALKYQDLVENSGFIDDSLKQVIDEQKLEIMELFNKLKNSPSPQRLYAANARVKTFEQQNMKLQQMNDSLMKDNVKYKEHIAQAKVKYDEISSDTRKLLGKYQDLEKKSNRVNFSINEFNAIPVRVKRDKREKTYKTSRIDELDISFLVVGNELIDNGEKEISIRIIGTNNEVLGADNDVLTESSKLVSMVEKFDYTGKSTDFNVTFKQEEKWKPGQHTIELLHNGKVIDRIAFILD